MSAPVAIVDYGRGNLFSLRQALRHAGADSVLVSDATGLVGAQRILLPGVGAFGDAMAVLRRLGLVEPIREAASRGVPIFGVCLGMQLLATRSEEFGDHAGLDLVPGVVRRLPEGDGPGSVRIPNMGWWKLVPAEGGAMLAGLPGDGMVYFLHAYGLEAADARDVLATIRVNGRDVAAVIRRGNLLGAQFHPEKSGQVGLAILRRLLKYSEVSE